VAMRLRTIQAGPAIQIPVFLVLFLAPVYVPLSLLSGWVEATAQINPFTALLEGGRDLISGGDVRVWLVYGAVLAMMALFAVWGVRGLRRAEAAG
jgi:ABC-2 type transport system permease protein